MCITRCDPTREVHVLKLCQGHKNVVKLIEILGDEVSGDCVKCCAL